MLLTATVTIGRAASRCNIQEPGRALRGESSLMPPKRQHYVPRLHLKHFVGTEPKGQIWTYDKETGKKWSGTPENTAVETHFYSVENDATRVLRALTPQRRQEFFLVSGATNLD